MSERDYGTTEEDVTDDSAEVTTRPAGGDDNAAMPDSQQHDGNHPQR
jgi:hypothetical protein